MTSRYILIADDDPLLRDLVAMALRIEGHEIAAVADGREALVSVRRRAPHLLILDANMPVLDGFAALRALKADDATRHIPVLMLTGRRGREDVVMARALGASDYVVKPFEALALTRRAAALLGRGPSRNATRADSCCQNGAD